VLEVYWTCLLGGLALALVVVFVGDAVGGAFDGLGDHAAFDPLSLIGGLTAFGGAGVVISAIAAPGEPAAALSSAVVALVLASVLHFAYVRPMRRAENSTSFSLREYAGRLGEVNTAVPAGGYGEVLVRMGASTTFQPAASIDGRPIPTGTAVVVVEVEKDGSLRVAPFDDEVPTPPLSDR
jgi:membrane protein implicated in regulation of membrane protease activity